MSEPSEGIGIAEPATESPGKPRPVSEAKMRAQRANAQRSTGPRTAAGRRRSAMNCRRIRVAPQMADVLNRPGGLKDLQRLFRDLLALFWFVDRQHDGLLEAVAWAWWQKLQDVRRRGLPENGEWPSGQDFEIEERLGTYIGRFAWSHPRWEYRLHRIFGEGSAHDMRRLRKAVEKKLPLFGEIAARRKVQLRSASEEANRRFLRAIATPTRDETAGDQKKDTKKILANPRPQIERKTLIHFNLS